MQGARTIHAVPDEDEEVEWAAGIFKRRERKAGKIINLEIEDSSNDTAAVERKSDIFAVVRSPSPLPLYTY